MELVPSAVALSFEVTFDQPGLSVAMSVYDTSGGSPVLLGSRTAMTLVYGNTYSAKFTPAIGKTYVIVKAVYTDGTFVTLDPNYSQGSESIYAQVIGSGSGGGLSLVGIVDACCDCFTQQTPFQIFTGDDATLPMKVITGSGAGKPLDLTSATEIDVALPNADGTVSHLLLSLGKVTVTSPAVLGQFTVTITEAVSAILNPGVLQNVDVTFTISGLKTTVKFFQAISVFEKT